MALVVNTNIAALQAWRNLATNESNLAKSLERLSSGLRINRAADDAAGLAISESMKAQIRGLNQAVRNAQDGISMVQTAESAMGQIQDMLQRMRELATQAASDGLTDADRGQIQKEMNQLAHQITYVANTTQYNNKKVISGQYASGLPDSEQMQIQVGANTGEVLTFNIAAMDAATLGVGVGVTGASATGTSVLTTISSVGTGLDPYAQYRVVFTTSGGTGTVTLQKSVDGTTWTDLEATIFTVGATAVELGTGEETITVDFATPAPTAATTVSLTLTTSVGTPGSSANGWVASVSGGINVSTKTAAASAIKVINDAIKKVSDNRAELGAIQNRLEYSIANLQVASENLQAANSRIRDVDMAAEMANFTKQQILQQAGVAMLAQANTQPQAILQLLR